jgi:DNA-binding response OmpR family regulator
MPLSQSKNCIGFIMNHQAFAQKMRSYTVLYVEDDVEVRHYISQFLERYCQKVYACESSEEGMELYKKYKPNILLLDINLPGMSGIDFATKVRIHDKKTPILISTAYTDKAFMLRAIELQLTRYLVKPMTSEDLFNAFEKCLEALEERIELGEGYIYSKATASILKGDSVILLRKKEAEILEFFIQHEEEVVRYVTLENSIWVDEVMTRDAIRSQIRNIRKKIGINLFENISGIGYKFSKKSLS